MAGKVESGRVGGTLTVRKAYARQGMPYCVITMPQPVVQALDLRVGDQLMYVITERREIVFRLMTDAITEMGYDPVFAPKRPEQDDWKKGRPDSIHNRAVDVERVARQMTRQLTGKDPSKFMKAPSIDDDPALLRAEREAQSLIELHKDTQRKAKLLEDEKRKRKAKRERAATRSSPRRRR